MKIALGNDHAGLKLRRAILKLLAEEGHEVLDLGTDDPAPVDYPQVALKVAHAVANGEADLGIFPCGSGLGPAIAANKVSGIRAVTCHDVWSARISREHNDANLLTLGERVIGEAVALEVVRAWLAEPFSGAERHQRRLDQITAAEKARCY